MKLFLLSFLGLCRVSTIFGYNPYAEISSKTASSKASSNIIKIADDRVGRFLSDDYYWNQVGGHIKGESKNDRAGAVAISSDGTVIAIGASHNDGIGDRSGHTRIFKYNGSSWAQVGSDIDGVAIRDFSGTSVALSADGNTVAIGSPFYEATATIFSTGHVRVYILDSGTWKKHGEDIVSEPRRRDLFGSALAFSSIDNMLVIGAPSNKINRPGFVSFYSFEDKKWQKSAADIVGDAVNDKFGTSLAISESVSVGIVVAIGALGNSNNASTTGYVQVFLLSGSGSGSGWYNQSKLGESILGNPNDGLGQSVALSSDGYTLAVGAPKSSNNGSTSGCVYVYSFESPSWSQLGNTIDGEENGSLAGDSLDISSDGSILAIGAPGNKSGQVSVYYFNNNSWDQRGDNIEGDGPGDAAGKYVAMSSNGTQIAIGAPDNDERTGTVKVMQSHLTTSKPSCAPSLDPSSSPSVLPSLIPSVTPSSMPSSAPSLNTSVSPTGRPSSIPSTVPSAGPSLKPTGSPSRSPSVDPSSIPSALPSALPTSTPTNDPSVEPSTDPSSTPSTIPSRSPSVTPSSSPSVLPSLIPSVTPSSMPSSAPSLHPSVSPTGRPSSIPSTVPSAGPSLKPTGSPSRSPSVDPSSIPSALPSALPTSTPTNDPSVEPSVLPSRIPTLTPTSYPSGDPSTQPTASPTWQPSVEPSTQPTSSPTSEPSAEPSSIPTSSPTSEPSLVPSSFPTSHPTTTPSVKPSSIPTNEPSVIPSAIPSGIPTENPSTEPTSKPTSNPSIKPSVEPSTDPSSTPSTIPSSSPSIAPSSSPSVLPSLVPSMTPSSIPSSAPSLHPSVSPTGRPSSIPSTVPTNIPSFRPSYNCPVGMSLFEIELQTDSNYDETAYIVQSGTTGSFVLKELMTTCLSSQGIHTEHKCLADDKCYRFTITDLGGDGICCINGNGWYKLRYKGAVLKNSNFEAVADEVQLFGDCN